MSKWWEPASKEDKKEDGKKEDEIELKPADVKAKLDQIDGLKTSVDALTSKSAVLDNMQEFLNEQAEDKRKKLEAERVAANSKGKEELEEEFLTDPEKATRRLMQPIVESNINLTSRNMTRDMMESNPERFDLYSDPTFRSTVDSMIASLPVANRVQAASIENCYYVAEGRLKQEIKDGKIKSRFAAASGSASGTGASGGKGEETITLTEQQKKAASIFGMSEKDYAAASKKEGAYV